MDSLRTSTTCLCCNYGYACKKNRFSLAVQLMNDLKLISVETVKLGRGAGGGNGGEALQSKILLQILRLEKESITLFWVVYLYKSFCISFSCT